MRYRSLVAMLLALFVGFTVTACGGAPQQQGPLTYDQIHSTGLAALCPEVSDVARGKVPMTAGQVVKLDDVCFQPVSIEAEEERRGGDKEFVRTKNLTRKTFTLGPAQAEIVSNGDTLEFNVLDGMTFQAITAQLPGNEQVPTLLSIKKLRATGESSDGSINASLDFEGTYSVPGYRSSMFLDPRGRGSETGYEMANGLQAAQDEFPEGSIKTDDFTQGKISIQIARVDPYTGELAGNFISYQKSSDEQGTLESRLVRVQGLFYARIVDES
ncbi:photosystem II manganese-stabilizing polypeptide [Synechococcus sp. PCC 7336]|uniref:photosystem II manganese-stabilizing polypeptide n=1 Tax=Synechococcus sp. PCC 7336 TaxID=195250 RepID=UPI0003484C59|nr:photosystem II manganese-stabilizing polypeptide [Synechococcus sp. PCC 7336]